MSVKLPTARALGKLLDQSAYESSNIEKHTQSSLINDPDLLYQSGSDAVIELNGIVVDECYDLQFSYREMKEPVYGYRSKHFDHVLPGTVLIQGQFTLNYVHDKYMSAIISHKPDSLMSSGKELKNAFSSYSGGEGDFSYADALLTFNQMRQSAEEAGQLAENLTSRLAIIDEEITLLKKQKAQELKSKEGKASVVAADLKKYDENMIGNTTARDAKANIRQRIYSVLMDQYSKNETAIKENTACEFDIQKILLKADPAVNVNDGDIKELIPSDVITIKSNNPTVQNSQTNQQLKNQALSVLSAKWTEWPFPNTDAKKYASSAQQIESANKEKELLAEAYERKLATMTKVQGQIKAELKEAQETQQNFSNQKGALSKSYDYMKNAANLRLEDIKNYESNANTIDLKRLLAYNSKYTDGVANVAEDLGEFKIAVSYHGNKHFTLYRCTLTGHTDVLGLGGEPVKRYYTFIAARKG
jgi:hypothetical protein